MKENDFILKKARHRRYHSLTITDVDNADTLALLVNTPAQAKSLLPRVTYWPSTQLSIEKQVHSVEDLTLTCRRVEFGADATLTRSRWMSNNYITRCHRQFELVGVRVAVRGSENQLSAEGLRPQDPWLSSPAEWERSAAKDRRTWGQYVAVYSVFNSPLTHNPFATLSNKVWEVYFSKEVCSFVIIVDYVSAYICIRIVAFGYITLTYSSTIVWLHH